MSKPPYPSKELTQIINRYLSSVISANHDNDVGFQLIVKSLYPLLFLCCRISFDFYIIAGCTHENVVVSQSKDVAGLPQLMAIVCGFAVILVIEILGKYR